VNKTVVIASLAGIVAIAGGVYALTRNRDAYECLAVYQRHFQDPKSADILSTKRSERELEVDFTIANAFGGRQRHQITCVLSDGSVDPALSKTNVALWSLERLAR
jgi:hypothetical protein